MQVRHPELVIGFMAFRAKQLNRLNQVLFILGTMRIVANGARSASYRSVKKVLIKHPEFVLVTTKTWIGGIIFAGADISGICTVAVTVIAGLVFYFSVFEEDILKVAMTLHTVGISTGLAQIFESMFVTVDAFVAALAVVEKVGSV